LTTIRYNN